MQCYTRSDDYFGEVERFIRLQRGARNIDDTQSKTATAQLNTISGDSEKKAWWANDYNFVRTAAVVLRMLMLRATKIHANLDKVWKNKLVSWGSIALTCNKDSIHTDGEGEIPCPADDLIEAGRIAAYYDTQFPAKKMMLQIRDVRTQASWFTETMAVVKKGKNDIKFWFIITTWRICKDPQKRGGFLYEAVPLVAVVYMQGNRQARDDWRQEERQDMLQLEQLMENLNIDANLRQAIRDNRTQEPAAAHDEDDV